MENGFARTYGVELLFESPPQINKRDLLQQLRKHCGNVAPLDDETSVLLSFVYLDHPVTFSDGTVPAQSFMTISDKSLSMETVESALQQSWDWPEARAVVERSRATMIITDLMSSMLAYKVRLELFHNVLVSLLELTSCLAIHWRPSQRFVPPDSYLDARRSDHPDPLFPAVNVRLFNVRNRAPGEKLMDSIGLAALGLPDVQCHFIGLEPNDVATMLYNAAYYLFEHGDVIDDGDTIQGIPTDQRWTCQHELALAAPEREVIDINPGPPYAAGDRQ